MELFSSCNKLFLKITIIDRRSNFRTVTNVTGDVAVTLMVAKTENMLDMEKFKS